MLTIGLLEKMEMNKNAEIVERKFSFYDKSNTAVIGCSHVINRDEPILVVSHCGDDSMWKFLCRKYMT